MKNAFLIFKVVLILSFFNAVRVYAQYNSNQDIAPNVSEVFITSAGERALWDIQFNYNLTTATAGDMGMAGACFFNNEFWVSRWGSDALYRFTATGILLSEFTIAGVTGVRSITTNGTNLYMANNTNTLYEINPMTQTLIGTITSSAPVTSRFLTYDASLNSGSGGFWTGNFSTDIVAISMTGTVLSTIPAATHGLAGMYGAAIDPFTTGGPYLWVFNQGGANNMELTQLQLPGGTPTGLTHDVMSDVGLAQSLTSGLAGGCFISNQIVPGEVTLGGIVQGTPDNVLFGYELTAPASNIDAEVTGIRTTKGYKQIPVRQVSADSVFINLRNSGSVNIDSMIVDLELFHNSSSVYTEQIVVLNTPGFNDVDVYSLPFTANNGLGTYQIKATVNTGFNQTDATTSNDTMSYIFTVTDTVFARDNGIPDGGTGYVVSMTEWAYAVTLFDLPVADTLTGIWIQLATPNDLDTTRGVVLNTTAGIPSGIPSLSPIQIISSSQNTYFLNYPGGVPLSAGLYAFGCYEGVNTGINLAQSPDVYTPGVNFFYTGTSGAWTPSGIQTARFIRPVFKSLNSFTGISQISEQHFNVFPNPTDGQLTIKSDLNGNFNYSITDINGKQMKSGIIKGEQDQLNVSDLSNGFYILNIFSESQVIEKQVFIRK